MQPPGLGQGQSAPSQKQQLQPSGKQAEHWRSSGTFPRPGPGWDTGTGANRAVQGECLQGWPSHPDQAPPALHHHRMVYNFMHENARNDDDDDGGFNGKNICCGSDQPLSSKYRVFGTSSGGFAVL